MECSAGKIGELQIETRSLMFFWKDHILQKAYGLCSRASSMIKPDKAICRPRVSRPGSILPKVENVEVNYEDTLCRAA